MQPGNQNEIATIRHADLETLLRQGDSVILGKSRQIRQAVACLLARGHLLIEDLPGVGKTTLAHLLAKLFGLEFRRIQFTSDMLPADIIGATVYEHRTGGFRFHAGPVFTQLVLADEVNRATPKTQSSLLEAMEERQVTVEGETRQLPNPFFVVATQNPGTQIGTFPLPESQLDRFLMRIELGYPGHSAERDLLMGQDRRALLEGLAPVMDAARLLQLQEAVAAVHTAPAVIDYVQALVSHTRQNVGFQHGLSPRAGLALLRAARAWTLLEGRDAVLPEDIQAVFPAVVGHRLEPMDAVAGTRRSDHALRILQAVTVP